MIDFLHSKRTIKVVAPRLGDGSYFKFTIQKIVAHELYQSARQYLESDSWGNNSHDVSLIKMNGKFALFKHYTLKENSLLILINELLLITRRSWFYRLCYPALRMEWKIWKQSRHRYRNVEWDETCDQRRGVCREKFQCFTKEWMPESFQWNISVRNVRQSCRECSHLQHSERFTFRLTH